MTGLDTAALRGIRHGYTAHLAAGFHVQCARTVRVSGRRQFRTLGAERAGWHAVLYTRSGRVPHTCSPGCDAATLRAGRLSRPPVHDLVQCSVYALPLFAKVLGLFLRLGFGSIQIGICDVRASPSPVSIKNIACALPPIQRRCNFRNWSYCK